MSKFVREIAVMYGDWVYDKSIVLDMLEGNRLKIKLGSSIPAPPHIGKVVVKKRKFCVTTGNPTEIWEALHLSGGIKCNGVACDKEKKCIP